MFDFQSFRPRRDADPRASRVFHSAYEEIRRLLDLTSRNVIGEINPTTVFQASSLLAAADFAVENERASYSQTSGQQTDNLRQLNAGFH